MVSDCTSTVVENGTRDAKLKGYTRASHTLFHCATPLTITLTRNKPRVSRGRVVCNYRCSMLSSADDSNHVDFGAIQYSKNNISMLLYAHNKLNLNSLTSLIFTSHRETGDIKLTNGVRYYTDGRGHVVMSIFFIIIILYYTTCCALKLFHYVLINNQTIVSDDYWFHADNTIKCSQWNNWYNKPVQLNRLVQAACTGNCWPCVRSRKGNGSIIFHSSAINKVLHNYLSIAGRWTTSIESSNQYYSCISDCFAENNWCTVK